MKELQKNYQAKSQIVSSSENHWTTSATYSVTTNDVCMHPTWQLPPTTDMCGMLWSSVHVTYVSELCGALANTI